MSAVTSTFAVAGAARLGSSAELRGKAIRATARGASVAPARGATLRVNADGTDHAPARSRESRPRVASPSRPRAPRRARAPDVTSRAPRRRTSGSTIDVTRASFSFSFRALSARAATAAPS
jgi:hypothetical protein